MTLILELFSLAIFILAIILTAFTWWIIRYFLVGLPIEQKDILERFSHCIANQVSLEYASLPEVQQKQVAQEKIRNIFSDQKIMEPAGSMIESSIADAFYRRKCNEANEWIRDLKADLEVERIAETPTCETPIPAEDGWII